MIQSLKHTRLLLLILAVTAVTLAATPPSILSAAHAGGGCDRPFVSVSVPLNDLGAAEYVRMDGTPTGFYGGLYPGGSNSRPLPHTQVGLALAQQIVPLDTSGAPAANGRVVMVGIGMSNTFSEYQAFAQAAYADPDIASALFLLNGAQPGQTASAWVDPNAPTWDEVDNRLAAHSFTPAQVQAAWVKLAQTGGGAFPAKAQSLQADLVAVARNLKIRYPNIKLAYFSSRTRAYDLMDDGLPPDLSPEPVALETGFAVKWLIEQQLNGDPTLNFDPANGPVVAPWLSWGPYLWIDGENARSDGRVWLPTDLQADCTHPAAGGNQKAAAMLLEFFKSDNTAVPWFLADGIIYQYHVYLPFIQRPN